MPMICGWVVCLDGVIGQCVVCCGDRPKDRMEVELRNGQILVGNMGDYLIRKSDGTFCLESE